MINEEGHEREMRPGKKGKEKGKEVASRLLTGTVFTLGGGRCGTKRTRPAVPHWEGMRSEIPELLPGESHGRRSLVGCRPWGR